MCEDVGGHGIGVAVAVDGHETVGEFLGQRQKAVAHAGLQVLIGRSDEANVRLLQVQSAEDMLRQCLDLLPDCDVFIACAAVADYRPAAVQPHKIKKGAEQITLELVRNPDIVATVSASDKRPFTVGFAAETNDVEAYARDKMQRKGLDMIIANDVSDPSIGFNSDQNAATVLWRGGQREIGPVRKDAMAREIIELLAGLLDPSA